MYVGGSLVLSAGRVLSAIVFGIRIGFCGNVSPGGSGTCHMLFLSPLPWLNQSRVMNWIQAAASEFSDVAGSKRSRVSSSRLMTRGLGAMMRGSGSGQV